MDTPQTPANSVREQIYAYVMLARTGRPEVDYDGITNALLSLITEAETKARQNLVNEVSSMHAVQPYNTFREWLYAKHKPENILVNELKDLSKTFTDSADVSYTGQQVHQVIDARLAALKETHEG